MADDLARTFAGLQAQFQQMIDTMGPTMESAFTRAFSSDSVSDTLYNSFASANYDSTTDLKIDDQIAAQEKAMAERAGRNGEAEKFSVDDLLKISETKDSDVLADTLRDIREGNIALSSAVTGAIHENSDKVSNIHTPIPTAEGRDQSNPNQDKKEASGKKDEYVGLGGDNVLDNKLYRMFDEIDRIKKQHIVPQDKPIYASKLNVPAPVSKPNNQSLVKPNISTANQPLKVDSIDLDKRFEQVFSNMNPQQTSSQLNDAKRSKDMTDRVYGSLPPYISKGNKVFDKILDTDFNAGAHGLGNMLSRMGNMGLGTLVLGAITSIAAAVTALYDFLKTDKERSEEQKEQEEKEQIDWTNKAAEMAASGDARADWYQAEADIHEARANYHQRDIDNAIFSKSSLNPFMLPLKIGGKISQWIEGEKPIEAAEERARQLKEIYGMKQALAGSTKAEDVSKWQEETKTKLAAEGIDVNDKELFNNWVKQQYELLNIQQEKAKQPASGPNKQDKSQQQSSKPAERPKPSQPVEQPKDKPAAGSTETKSSASITAGTGMPGVTPITPEMQKNITREATTDGVKAAFTSPEVQSLLTASAQTAGNAVNTKLMGA